MKIAVIGAVFMDAMGRPTAGHFDPKGRNVGRVDFIHGGVGRNIAEDLRNAGAEVALLSSVDSGPLGDAVLDHLQQASMDCRYIAAGPGGMGVWLVVTDLGGDAAASISQQLDFSLMEAMLTEHGEEFLAPCDALALECDTTDEIFRSACELSRRLGKPLYGAASNMECILRHKELLAGMDCFVCNEIEFGRLFEEDYEKADNDSILSVLREKAPALGLRRIVVTTGQKGAVWLDIPTGEGGHRAPFASEVRDTSGAGDSFFAGLVFALCRGYSLPAAVDIGSLFAARTIEHIGPVRPDLGKFILEGTAS